MHSDEIMRARLDLQKCHCLRLFFSFLTSLCPQGHRYWSISAAKQTSNRTDVILSYIVPRSLAWYVRISRMPFTGASGHCVVQQSQRATVTVDTSLFTGKMLVNLLFEQFNHFFLCVVPHLVSILLLCHNMNWPSQQEEGDETRRALLKFWGPQKAFQN